MGTSYIYQPDPKDRTMSLAKPRPNTKDKCESCGQLPTVDITANDGTVIHSTYLCGPCCFGEYECIDPDKW